MDSVGNYCPRIRKEPFLCFALFSKTSYIDKGPSTIASEEWKAFVSPLPLFVSMIFTTCVKVFTAKRGQIHYFHEMLRKNNLAESRDVAIKE